MKKLLCLLVILISATVGTQAQPVKKVTGEGEIQELKELTIKYCKVYLNQKPKDWIGVVESDTQISFFVNKETGKNVIFHGYVELLNLMSKEGWKLISHIPADNAYFLTGSYLFEKK